MTETKEIKHSPDAWRAARQRARAEVKAKVDIFKICEAQGVELRLAKSSREPRAGDRVFSPLRDDGKSPGFLLVGEDGNGRAGRVVGAKDMSTKETYDVFSFAEALTGKDFKEAADWLQSMAGVRVEDYLPAANGSVAKPKPQAPETDYARRKRMRALADRAHDKFAEPMARIAKLPPVRQADAWIAAAWKSGREDSAMRIPVLASARGWPVEWVQSLYDMGEISWPELPWSRKHCIAFRVRHPDLMGATWRTLGYHQRVVLEKSKFWVYCPYVPDEEKCRTEYQHTMRRAGRRIPALPFVIGDPYTAKRWVIAEGQWDALTAYGMLGGFDGRAEDLCALGLRGAGSVEPLQAAYEPFWCAHPPEGVAVLRDNDKAGSALAAWQPSGHRDPPKMNFDDRLRAVVGHGKVKVLCPDREGWDFNDLYKNCPELHTKMERELTSAWT